MKEVDRKAIFGVCAVVMPFAVFTLISFFLERIGRTDVIPLAVIGLAYVLSLYSGYIFVLRGWPKQAGLLALAYFPGMLVALLFFTIIMTGVLGSDSL